MCTTVHPDEDLAVADFAGACSISNGFDHIFNAVAFNHHFNLDFLQELNSEFRTAIALHLSFLPSTTSLTVMPMILSATLTSSSLKGRMIDDLVLFPQDAVICGAVRGCCYRTLLTFDPEPRSGFTNSLTQTPSMASEPLPKPS